MCLILLAYRTHPDADVILAGNRDEFYARPTAPPALIAEAPRIYAGRDLEAGGTWLGRNEHGLIASLTNRRAVAVPPDARSRGEIVQGLLSRPTAADAAAWLGTLEVARYRPFNLLFGDARQFYFAASDAGARPRALPPGLHVLSNSTLNDASWPKVARSQAFLQRTRNLDGEALLLALQAYLCDPTAPQAVPPGADDGVGGGQGPLGAVFVDTGTYGTVSASILTSGGRLGERYYYAEREAMRAAQTGWARAILGNGGAPGAPSATGPSTAPPPQGSPFRRLSLEG